MQTHSFPIRRPMLLALHLAMCAMLAIASGCQSRMHRVLMNGAMNMSGKMAMDGKMAVDGKIDASLKPDNTASPLSAISLQSGSPNCCKVAIIDIDGVLINKNISGMGAMGENPVSLFREKLDTLRGDSAIRAVVLRINSPGGGVTATDIMARDLRSYKQQTQVPVVACLMDVGAGGAYLLATEADMIVAHPTSIVGGIGVILNLYNLEDTLGQFNIASIPIKSGAQIDIASPERVMEPLERKSLQTIADSFHERFVEQVQASRQIDPEADKIFDGRILTGTDAQEVGLVDEVGYLDDAIAIAQSRAGIGTDAGVVMLRRDNDRAYSQFDVTPNTPYALLPIKLPGLDRSSLPTFLYLWQPDPSIVPQVGG